MVTGQYSQSTQSRNTDKYRYIYSSTTLDVITDAQILESHEKPFDSSIDLALATPDNLKDVYAAAHDNNYVTTYEFSSGSVINTVQFIHLAEKNRDDFIAKVISLNYLDNEDVIIAGTNSNDVIIWNFSEAEDSVTILQQNNEFISDVQTFKNWRFLAVSNEYKMNFIYFEELGCRDSMSLGCSDKDASLATSCKDKAELFITSLISDSEDMLKGNIHPLLKPNFNFFS